MQFEDYKRWVQKRMTKKRKAHAKRARILTLVAIPLFYIGTAVNPSAVHDESDFPDIMKVEIVKSLKDSVFVRNALSQMNVDEKVISKYLTMMPYIDNIEDKAHVLGLPYGIGTCIAYEESRFNHRTKGKVTRSKRGAYGKFQVRYSAFLQMYKLVNDSDPYFVNLRKANPNVVELLENDMKGTPDELWVKVKTDSTLNENVGLAYFDCLQTKHGTEKGLELYNAGETGVRKYPNNACWYRRRVMGHYADLKAGQNALDAFVDGG